MKDGDASAQKALYCTYAGYLTGVCTRYLSDPEDVKDVLHDSFLLIFSSMTTFEYRGSGSLKAWLTKIVINTSLQFIRHTYRKEILYDSPDPEETEPDEPPLLDGLTMETLHKMIRELPPGYRTVFNLYVFEQKTHKEIASLLNIKEASSASQFHRAKSLLATRIKTLQSNNP
ncbi:MAG: sigma-70 family RNA polymerase sigma factor [Muribaculaceae bacterium]|nr:sigma-70 family RNA polymerase sigma factor [Muribaculaceae bacterium]MDE6551948.1 sigma-70 family RNA polymerase sigma factor [Muribaculaceae bacterium]